MRTPEGKTATRQSTADKLSSQTPEQATAVCDISTSTFTRICDVETCNTCKQLIGPAILSYDIPATVTAAPAILLN